MQRYVEQRIRFPRRIGDKIGGNLQALQINAKMEAADLLGRAQAMSGPVCVPLHSLKAKVPRPSAAPVGPIQNVICRGCAQRARKAVQLCGSAV